MESLLPVCTEKKLSVAYTETLLALFRSNISLIYHTPFSEVEITADQRT